MKQTLRFAKGNLRNYWEVHRKGYKPESLAGTISFCNINKRWEFTPFMDDEYTNAELKEISQFMDTLEKEN